MPFAPLLLGLFASQVPEPPAARDEWEAPPTCPDRAALARAIERRLGRPLADGEVRLAGAISRRPGEPQFHLRLELTVAGRSQTRSLTAARCPSLIDATALLIVLALTQQQASTVPQPPAVAGSDEPPESPDASEAGLDEPPADILEATRPDVVDVDGPDDEPGEASVTLAGPLPPTPPRRRLGGLVRVHGGPEYGALPGVTGALGLAAGLLWRRARLELQGHYLAPRTETQEPHALRVALFTGAAVGCGRPGRGRVEAPLCGGLELGGARWAATGPGARAGTDVWLAGVVTAGVAWHVARRWSVTAALHGQVHLYGPRYELQDPGPRAALFRPAPASGRLLIGLEVRLGDPW